jgi:ABC-type transport system involved in multi-copper enzyme maturation permease subunit
MTRIPSPPVLLLNVVERELRAASRGRGLVWVRLLVAGLSAFVAASMLQFYGGPTGGAGAPRAGKLLLDSLAWLFLVFCLAEGARQTSDTISREKRDGTLGLLFLTDLSAFEVAAGKFVSASLVTFYALIAAFPAIGLSILGGGTTAGEFWRTQLVLLNTLFLSGAAGLWVSARSRDESRALFGAVCLVLGVMFVPLAVQLVPQARSIPSISPVWLMLSADDGSYRLAPGRFWGSLLLGHLVAWGFGIAAGRATATSWREGPEVPAAPPKIQTRNGWGYQIGPRLHAVSRTRLLDRSPVAWLANRSAGQAPLIWLGVLAPLLTDTVQFLRVRGVGPGFGGHFMMLDYLGVFLGAGLLAVAAGRLFQQARRSGFLELLLGAPVTATEVVRDCWSELWRHLRWPLAVVLLAKGLGLGFQLLAWRSPAGGLGLPTLLAFTGLQLVQAFLKPIAVCWVGLWFGLILPGTGRVVGRIFLLVILVPWLGSLIFAMTMQYLASAGGPFRFAFRSWIPWWILMQLAAVAWLIGLTLWSWRLLKRWLRQAAAEPERFRSLRAWNGPAQAVSRGPAGSTAGRTSPDPATPDRRGVHNCQK